MLGDLVQVIAIVRGTQRPGRAEEAAGQGESLGQSAFLGWKAVDVRELRRGGAGAARKGTGSPGTEETLDGHGDEAAEGHV